MPRESSRIQSDPPLDPLTRTQDEETVFVFFDEVTLHAFCGRRRKTVASSDVESRPVEWAVDRVASKPSFGQRLLCMTAKIPKRVIATFDPTKEDRFAIDFDGGHLTVRKRATRQTALSRFGHGPIRRPGVARSKEPVRNLLPSSVIGWICALCVPSWTQTRSRIRHSA